MGYFSFQGKTLNRSTTASMTMVSLRSLGLPWSSQSVHCDPFKRLLAFHQKNSNSYRRSSIFTCMSERDRDRRIQTGTVRKPSVDSPIELPCLPFPASDVLQPGQEKILHLFEARYLALLEEVMARGDNLFAHVVVTAPHAIPASFPGACSTPSFCLSHACLVRMTSLKRVDVGAVLTVRGEGRLRLSHLTDQDPYIRASAYLMLDDAPAQPQKLTEAADALKLIVMDLVQLAGKLPMTQQAVAEMEAMEAAFRWVTEEPAQMLLSLGCSETEQASRLSFAALQEIPFSSSSERQQIVKARLSSMAVMDTLERLQIANEVLSQAKASLAAKLALHTAFGSSDLSDSTAGK